ncbi:MAG: mandelate racemase/muconate lactonizing enzyme family protein [Acidobacteria bacterium]|nr:mandelate racemase/muconate lactonizing enzyme family protein [Acidobacteriota bacterium]
MINRRQALTAALGGAWAAHRPLLGATKPVIASMEIFQVKVNHRGNWVIVRLKTDTGVTGLGEASHGLGDAVTIQLIEQLFASLKGRSAFDVEWLHAHADPLIQRQKNSTAASAVSGLEQAMWDIQGKVLGVPCYQLFGGALRRDIRHYANINRCTVERTPAGFRASAKRAVADGFDAIKLAPFDGIPKPGAAGFQAGVDNGVACIEAVREVLGAKGDLLVDGHDRFDVPSGLELVKRMIPLNLYWLEEVTPPPGLPEIDRAAPMKTAGGELLYGMPAFRQYLQAGSVDIIMPDVKYCGGMLELKKSAAVAEAFGVPVSPHGPASPIGNAAAAHVCASMPNFLILELGYGEVDWRSSLVTPPERFERGVMKLTDKPGLGIELNDAVAAAHRVA